LVTLHQKEDWSPIPQTPFGKEATTLRLSTYAAERKAQRFLTRLCGFAL
jgi:hypothetical protein